MTQPRLRKCKIGNWQEEIAFELDRKAMVAKAREQAQQASAAATSTNESSAALEAQEQQQQQQQQQQTSGKSAASAEFFKLANTAATNAASLSAQIMAKRDHHLQATELAPAETPGGYVPMGLPIMMQNAETQGFLGVDIQDRSGAGKHMKICATTGPAPAKSKSKSVLRNTWVLLPMPEDIETVKLRYEATRSVAAMSASTQQPEADPNHVLHYGQRFCICSLEEMCVAAVHGDAPGPIFLASEPKTPQAQSKRSAGQEVFFTPAVSQKCWWTAVHPHPEYRQDMELTPVKANSVLVLRHQLTATPLASTKTMYPNDFGAECEVSANRFLKVRVRNGNTLETEANLWAFITAEPAEAEE